MRSTTWRKNHNKPPNLIQKGYVRAVVHRLVDGALGDSRES